MDHGVADSVADWILCRFAQQKLLEFLLDFCTGHRTCETKRDKQQNWGDPWAICFSFLLPPHVLNTVRLMHYLI